MGATYLNSTAHAKCLVGNPQPPNRQPFLYSLRADSDISLVANCKTLSVRIQPQVHHSTLFMTHQSLKDLIGVKTYTHTPPLAPHNINLPLPPQTSQLSPAST